MAEMQPQQIMDPSFLIGAQLETYQKLIVMGFNQTDSATVAQVFGSNVDGAVNCVLTGGAAKLTKMNSVDQSAPKKRELWKIPMYKDKDEIIKFRITPFSDKLMSGYIRRQSIDYVIPHVIHTIIIKYFNLYFIKLNYNINNNDDLIDEMDQKHVDHDDDDQKTELLPFRYKILVLQTNQSLRRIGIALEETYKYIYNDMGDYVDPKHYSYFIHFWMRFSCLKSIYPLNNKNMKVSMNDIDKINRETPDRWLEVPNDFEDITVHDIDKLIGKINKNGILELGIEIFDQRNQIWPFRNKQLLPLKHEIVTSNKVPSLLSPKDESPPTSPKITRVLPPLSSLVNLDVNEAVLRDWKCANCGRSNDKTYVICGGCFRDKVEAPNTARLMSPISLRAFRTLIQSDTDKLVQISQKPLPSTAPIPLSVFEWTKYLKIGDIIDAKDDQNKWYESVIRYIEINEENMMVLSVHYIGWNQKWDEKLLANDIQRIAKRNSYTIGPHRPKISHYNDNKLNPPDYAYPNYPTYTPKSFRFTPISLTNQYKESNGDKSEDNKRRITYSSTRKSSIPILPLRLLPYTIDDNEDYHSDTNAVIGNEDKLYLQLLANQAESDQDIDQL